MKSDDLNKIIDWIQNTKPGIYELKEKYFVLKEFTFNGKIYQKDYTVLLYPSDLKIIGENKVVKEFKSNFKEDTIKKIKYYIDFKRRCKYLKDVSFNDDFSKIIIHERIQDAI